MLGKDLICSFPNGVSGLTLRAAPHLIQNTTKERLVAHECADTKNWHRSGDECTTLAETS